MIPQQYDLHKVMVFGQEIHRLAQANRLSSVEVVVASILSAYVASTSEIPDKDKAIKIVADISMRLVMLSKEGLIGQ